MSGYSVEVCVGINTNENIIHTWLNITHPDGSKEAWGFHPAENMIYGKGEVQKEDPYKESSASSGQLPISVDEYNKLEGYINRTRLTRPDYSLPFGSQCTHWALRGLNEAGLIPDIITPNMTLDDGLLDIMETIIWNPVTQYVGFKINNFIEKLKNPDIGDPQQQIQNYEYWYENTQYRLPDPSQSDSYRIVYLSGCDPLALDLDGDGLETKAMAGNSGALFDHNNDGIRSASGWIAGDDGLLVRDINGNAIIDGGAELFGDNTKLRNGTTARDGFVALKDLDSNNDGKIDANDTAFGELKIWRDLNQDGISQADELKSLVEANIESLKTTATNTNTATSAGTQILTGSYTKTDGTTSTLADIKFTQDTFHSEYIEHIEIPESLQNLPNLHGLVCADGYERVREEIRVAKI